MPDIDARVVDTQTVATLRPDLGSHFDLPEVRLSWGQTKEHGPVVMVETRGDVSVVFQFEE